jgi:hypothetical protein
MRLRTETMTTDPKRALPPTRRCYPVNRSYLAPETDHHRRAGERARQKTVTDFSRVGCQPTKPPEEYKPQQPSRSARPGINHLADVRRQAHGLAEQETSRCQRRQLVADARQAVHLAERSTT